MPDDQPAEYLLFLDNLLSRSERLPKGTPETFGATPLDRVATLAQQLELAISLQALTLDAPDDAPLFILDYIHRTFLSRFHSRAEANEENYMTSLRPKSDFADNPVIEAMVHRAELGQASPTEILITRQLLGIRSVELACLTHPHGAQIEMLDHMRDAVKAHVEGFGGEYYKEPETRYRVKEVIKEEVDGVMHIRGLLMTRKRTLGMTQDGTIIRERSSFVLRTDQMSVLTDDEISKIAEVDTTSDTWQDDMVRAARLDEVVATLLDMDEFSYAMPISSTIYAYNPNTADLIAKRQSEETYRRRKAFANEWPTIGAAWGLEDIEPSHQFAGSSMLYVGPSIQPEDEDDTF